jgi:hypothetical protein
VAITAFSIVLAIKIYHLMAVFSVAYDLVAFPFTSHQARKPIRRRTQRLFGYRISFLPSCMLFVVFNSIMMAMVYRMAIRTAHEIVPDLPQHCGYLRVTRECINSGRVFVELKRAYLIGLLLLIRGLEVQNCVVLAVPTAMVHAGRKRVQRSWWRGVRLLLRHIGFSFISVLALLILMQVLAPKACPHRRRESCS